MIPVEISQTILGHVKDKGTLIRLLLVSHTFRLLADPYLYIDVSFCRQREYTVQKFLLGIAAGGGRCARFVKRLHLPIISPQDKLYELFQTILTLVSNLEDLELHPSRWTRVLTTFDLRDFLDVSPSASALKRFAWYSHCSLDSIGLTWFLTCQQSLECLTLMTFHTADSIPTLPKLRKLHTLNLAAARRFLETNRVTHLQIRNCTASLDLHDAALYNIVVCILRVDTLDVLSEAVVRMSNLECFEINVLSSTIPSALSRLSVLKGATKLRHLRIRTAGLCHLEDHPWDHNDVLRAFDSLPSLIYIGIVPSLHVPEYLHFTRGVLWPTKVCSLYPVCEWWHDWIDDYEIISLDQCGLRMGYRGDFFDAAEEFLSVEGVPR